jgi:hypothetical protein
MTPLRRRMIEDMQLRNFAPRTITVYVNCVARFARHFGRSPELLGPDNVRIYLLHMIERRRQSCTWKGRVDLGGRPPRPPTDPDVRVKRIWLFIS